MWAKLRIQEAGFCFVFVAAWQLTGAPTYIAMAEEFLAMEQKVRSESAEWEATA